MTSCRDFLVGFEDLSTATDDELVAIGGPLTEQLHRVYREMSHRRKAGPCTEF